MLLHITDYLREITGYHDCRSASSYSLCITAPFWGNARLDANRYVLQSTGDLTMPLAVRYRSLHSQAGMGSKSIQSALRSAFVLFSASSHSTRSAGLCSWA
jgi:hypothetical protein